MMTQHADGQIPEISLERKAHTHMHKEDFLPPQVFQRFLALFFAHAMQCVCSIRIKGHCTQPIETIAFYFTQMSWWMQILLLSHFTGDGQ